MKTINSTSELTEAILLLETRQADQGIQLREQFNLTYESLKPLNLIKSTFREAASSRELKDNIINTGTGLVAGYLSKKLFEGVSHSPLKNSWLRFDVRDNKYGEQEPGNYKITGTKISEWHQFQTS